MSIFQIKKYGIFIFMVIILCVYPVVISFFAINVMDFYAIKKNYRNEYYLCQ